jgi:hypothetical protein
MFVYAYLLLLSSEREVFFVFNTLQYMRWRLKKRNMFVYKLPSVSDTKTKRRTCGSLSFHCFNQLKRKSSTQLQIQRRQQQQYKTALFALQTEKILGENR